MGGQRHEGSVRDLSPECLYVLTAAELRPGADVVVSLRAPGAELFVLEASVAETRTVARSLAAASAGGAVLRIQHPPAAWLRFARTELGREA
jgi:hypothetical protein